MPEGGVATLTDSSLREAAEQPLPANGAPGDHCRRTPRRACGRAVARQLPVVHAFLTGSYRRQTLIGPLKRADVDIVVVLDRDCKQRGPRAVLELVKKALLVEYPKTPEISRNGQAVTITFSDFIIDVVPAFVRPWWTWDDGWDICDSGSDRWIATNPKRHVEISAGANRLHGGQLVPRIKQLKAWNRTVGEPLCSFHVEALAWSIFGMSWWWYSSQISDWASASYFFKKARGKTQRAAPRPGWHRERCRGIPPWHGARRGSEQGRECVRTMPPSREGIRGGQPSCDARGIRPGFRQLLPVLTATRLLRPLCALLRTLS